MVKAGGLIVILILFSASRLFLPGGITPKEGHSYFLIPTGSSWEQVIDTLGRNVNIRNQRIFIWTARKKNYPAHIKPGRYSVKGKMSYNAFVNMLRSGRQAPVKVTFNNIRSVYELAGKVGRQIEADSSSLAGFLSYAGNYGRDGFTRENVISIFIPDTYELYWNTSAEGFYNRMLKEFNRFWNGERKQKAEALDLTPVEVSILASIVDDEVAKAEEKPRIAGVYLNRLRRGMLLQACPTIKFALNDFTITRVLKKHMEVDSPYNTYKHKGLPPGPIGCPSKEGIDAVLNAEKHDYLFFAAKADFSGYHNFSRTLTEHNRYASEYQRELDRRKIFK